MIEGLTRLYMDSQTLLPRLPEVIISFCVGYLAILGILFFLGRALKLARMHNALVTILQSMASVVLWIVLLSQVLRLLGLSQVAVTLSGSLLVIGFALANGAQAFVSDTISGLFLARDPDFDIGFHIKAGETEGVIESIDIRKTRIRTAKGTSIILPNSLVDKERWEVLDKPVRHKRGQEAVGTIKDEPGEQV